MAKRYQPLKEFGRSTKKPKLEVSINKNPPGASTSKAAVVKPKSPPPTQKASTKPIADLWDDDEDDDVLLLATQVAESEIAAAGSKTKKPEVVADITDSEITFSEFEPKIVQHSTQQPTQNLFTQMFDEDDDDIALLAAAIEKDAKRYEMKHTKKDDEDVIFKKPALPQKTYQRNDDTSDDEPGPSIGKQKLPVSQFGKILIDKPGPSVSTKPKDSKPEFEELPEDMIIDVDELDPSVPASADPPHEMLIDLDDDDDQPGPSTRQKPMEIPQATVQSNNDQNKGSDQVKDLLKRLEALQNENEKLSSALTSVQDKMQTKSGEASVLRDELRQTKQKLDELKMAKMFQTETVNAESKKKIEELSKKVQDKEAELQLKNMECSVLKMRQTDETRRLEMTTTTMTTGDATIPNVRDKTDDLIDEESLRECSDVAMWQPTLRIECKALLPKEHVYESVKIESQHMRKWNTFITEKLSNLQRLLAKVQTDIYNVPNETSNEIIESVRMVFQEFTIYVEDLHYGFNEKILPEHDYDVLDEKNVRPASCMHFSKPLYPGERVISLRRYMAVLAVIFDRSPDVTRNFLAAVHDEKPLLNLAIAFINKIGCSLEVYPFFGLFEAFALILRTTLYHLDPEDVDDKPYTELLFNLLREIVFARPGPWAMYELSFSVIDIHARFPSMLASFCVNSPPETFTIDRQKGVYRFSHQSCLMQVYAGLTESSFPLYEKLNEEIFNLQAKICLNHIRFVFYCVTEPPDFIQKILSTYDEDDDSTDEEFFVDWIKRLCETDEEFNEINEFFLKRPNDTNKSQEQNVSGRTTSKTFEDKEQSTTSKEAMETLRKEKEGETTSRTYETFSDEKPTTSKKAAEAACKELLRIEEPNESRAKQPTESEVHEEGTNYQSSTTSNTAKTSTQCQCFEQLCLSAVRMIWLSLRQWLRFEKIIELERVRMISRVAVHLIYFLFSDNYLTCLLREDEDTTKHLMYLIYNWWVEHEEDLEFEEIQEELLKKIKNSPIIPKLFCEEEDKRENVAKDYAEWCRLSGLKFDPEACTAANLDRAIKNLRLVEDTTDIDLFMEFMEPPNIDMESFEFKGFKEEDDDYE